MPLKGTLTINEKADSTFRLYAEKFSCRILCIKEGVGFNRYKVECDDMCDIYALGQAVGIDAFCQLQYESKKH